MKTLLRTIQFAAVVSLSVMVSCKQDKGVNWEEIEPDGKQSELPISKDTTPFTSRQVAWDVSENGTVASDMMSRVQGTAYAAKGAQLIFVDKKTLVKNADVIAQRYQSGAVIVVINPDPEGLEDFMVDNGIVQIVPSADSKVPLYAFSMRGAYTVNEIGEAVEYEPSSTEKVEGAEATYECSDEDATDTQLLPTDALDFSDIGWYVRPFVDWVNVTTESKGSEWDGVATYNCQYTYNLDLFVHSVSKHSSDDRIKGPYTVFANYSYKPLYVYPDQSYSPGDYYSFNATYGCEMGQIFYGDNYENRHGGIYVHITGAFLRDMSVRTYIDGDGSNPQFVAGHEPIPASDIDTKNYSETKGWNVGGGVTGNYTVTGAKPSAGVTPSFNWGCSNSSTVSYSVSDLTIENNFQSNYSGCGASPAWTFICQNLPEPKGDKGFSGKTPLIAKSTLACQANWIWHTASHAEGDTKSIGKLTTTFSPYLGAAHNGYCVDGERNYYDIDDVTLKADFVVPFRTPFGTACINNTFKDGEVMSDISVCKVDDGEEVFHSEGDFSSDNPCEFSVAEGKYNVTMKVTDRSRVTKDYKMTDVLKITRRKSDNDVQQIDSFIRFVEEQ